MQVTSSVEGWPGLAQVLASNPGTVVFLSGNGTEAVGNQDVLQLLRFNPHQHMVIATQQSQQKTHLPAGSDGASFQSCRNGEVLATLGAPVMYQGNFLATANAAAAVAPTPNTANAISNMQSPSSFMALPYKSVYVSGTALVNGEGCALPRSHSEFVTGALSNPGLQHQKLLAPAGRLSELKASVKCEMLRPQKGPVPQAAAQRSPIELMNGTTGAKRGGTVQQNTRLSAGLAANCSSSMCGSDGGAPRASTHAPHHDTIMITDESSDPARLSSKGSGKSTRPSRRHSGDHTDGLDRGEDSLGTLSLDDQELLGELAELGRQRHPRKRSREDDLDVMLGSEAAGRRDSLYLGQNAGTLSDAGAVMAAAKRSPREKNREAQRRFRERQKCLVSSLKEKVVALSRQLKARTEEAGALREENIKLKAKLDARKEVEHSSRGKHQQQAQQGRQAATANNASLPVPASNHGTTGGSMAPAAPAVAQQPLQAALTGRAGMMPAAGGAGPSASLTLPAEACQMMCQQAAVGAAAAGTAYTAAANQQSAHQQPALQKSISSNDATSQHLQPACSTPAHEEYQEAAGAALTSPAARGLVSAHGAAAGGVAAAAASGVPLQEGAEGAPSVASCHTITPVVPALKA